MEAAIENSKKKNNEQEKFVKDGGIISTNFSRNTWNKAIENYDQVLFKHIYNTVNF